MKKQNIINLIKYHVERNENGFRNEAINIARYFDSIGDDQLAEYVMALVAESNLYVPQANDFETDFLKTVNINTSEPLNLLTLLSNSACSNCSSVSIINTP